MQLFFVLSGYLITGILLAELERRRTVDLLRFWMRRARRLYPALLVVCVAYLIYVAFNPSRNALIDVLTALTYTTNVSPTPGGGGYLGHTWSLAVEEQFYLAWPVLAIGAYRLGGRRGVGGLALALAGAVIAARFAWSFDANAYWRLLRWDAILLGCALAALPIRANLPAVLIAAWVLALLTIAPVLYEPLPFALASVACVVLVAGAARAPVLTWAPLCYLGRVSYGLYLWSCLLLRFPLPGCLAIMLSFIAAELSFRYVERPFLAPLRDDPPVIEPPGRVDSARGAGMTFVSEIDHTGV